MTRSISRELLIATGLSVVLHAAWLVREAKASLAHEDGRSELTFEAEMIERAPEPVKPPPAPEPESAQQPTEPAARNLSARAQPTRALPAAAQAGKTLTASEDSDAAVADFTMVQCEGSTYVGGTTSAIGTSHSAVRGPASPSAIARSGETGVGPAIPLGPDRSKSAMPEGSAWDCSRLYPADPDAGDYATVLIAVSLQADGTPKRVALLRDPGHGFGAAAIRCAMSQRYHAALDRAGNPVAATTPPITVRFTR